MRIGLVQEQSLKLNMTQELQQAIALLQYSSADLLSYVHELAMENPLIEVKETYRSPYRQVSKNSDKQSFIENTCKEKASLREHLRSQLIDFHLEKQDRDCLNLLIDAIDSNGYLKDCLADLASVVDVSEEFLESKLYFLQSLEPAGVGARSLQECILLQLRRLSARNYLAETIVEQHFQAFAEKSWKELSKRLKIKIIEIQAVHELVKKLEPRPGLKYESDDMSYVTPDMTIEKVDHKLHIIYHDELMPQLIIHHPLQSDEAVKEENETRDYYSKKLTQGKWLQRAIQQRKETMVNVMKVIVEKQEDFFLNGRRFLKPLTLKSIADLLDVHESTVSRAVKDKYVQTPHGLISMKTFFSTKLDEDKGDVSSAAVKIKLAEIISSENNKKPLSDQKLANLLKTDYDIRISRRTVTKYREQLNIPTSAVRKEY